jgi:prepilin-type N-terminal cleavage/methylation domain-containing protein
MKMRKNNRGFTLVELIVSTAILGIIAVAAGAFMVAGTRTYSSLNYTVRLQYEAQLAMAQLQEYTIDCTDGIAWDAAGQTLYIANNDGFVHVFDYDPAAQTISYGSGSIAENLTFPVSALAAEHVKSMNVDLAVKQANITLEMARGNKTYTATQIIALRNQPVQEETEGWAELWNQIK